MQINLKYFYLIVFIGILQATNIVCTTCDRDTVLSAYNSANEGDTVTVPSGNCSWGSAITLSKSITMKGGGSYSIDTSFNDTGTWPDTITVSGNAAFSISTSDSTDYIRITGFKFSGTPQTGYYAINSPRGQVVVGENNASNNWRIDNCFFYPDGANSIGIANSYGLIDHCYFYGAVDEQMKICIEYLRQDTAYHDMDNLISGRPAERLGIYNWSQDVNWGGANFVFIENCTFHREAPTNAMIQAFVDAMRGAKYVFRYNNVHKGYILTSHSRCCGWWPVRLARAAEVYNNNFVWDNNFSRDCGVLIRGGTAYIHNNTFDGSSGGINHVVKFYNDRIGNGGGPLGRCDGYTWDWDNQSGAAPCCDQPGAGKDAWTWGDGIEFDLYPGTDGSVYHEIGNETGNNTQQASEPILIWSNSRTNTGVPNSVSPSYITEDRDWFFSDDDTEEPDDYSTYTYPHPLQSYWGYGQTKKTAQIDSIWVEEME